MKELKLFLKCFGVALAIPFILIQVAVSILMLVLYLLAIGNAYVIGVLVGDKNAQATPLIGLPHNFVDEHKD